MTAAARLTKELMDSMKSTVEGISAFPDNDNLFHWIGTLQGASDTPYEGLEFQLSLKFSAEYPIQPPVVTFLTPCFHPNVDAHGAICLDILKECWSPTMTVPQVLLSIQSLLDNPNNASPLNPQAATLWANRHEFCRAVRVAYDTHQQQQSAATGSFPQAV